MLESTGKYPVMLSPDDASGLNRVAGTAGPVASIIEAIMNFDPTGTVEGALEDSSTNVRLHYTLTQEQLHRVVDNATKSGLDDQSSVRAAIRQFIRRHTQTMPNP
jgi:hypothetical protein